MHKPSISQLLYKLLYPRPRQTDPTSWSQHISRHLVPEVRLETAAFYGQLDNIEAQYPGLDYAYPPHRQRLWRYTHHRRLFRAFDQLHLTRDEIWSLCQWEGTVSAKQKYEADSDTRIRDTTVDDMARAEPPQHPIAIVEQQNALDTAVYRRRGGGFVGEQSTLMDLQEESEESGEEDSSCGVELNNHLHVAVEARSRGEHMVIDEDFERFVRNMERNGTGLANLENLIPTQNVCPTGESSSPASSSTANVAVSMSQPTNLDWALPRIGSAPAIRGWVPMIAPPSSSYATMATPAPNPPTGEAR